MDIFIRDFRSDEITRNLRQIALSNAGSIKSSGIGLAFTDSNTRSSLAERTELFYPLSKGSDDRVLAISDLTFMIPPQNSILDNDRLIANVADFLTTSERTVELADFPHFFKDDVDILLGRASLVNEATGLKSMLSAFQIGSEIQGVEDLSRDTVLLGLYDDAPSVMRYLNIAGVQVNGTLSTPFTPGITTVDTGIILLNRTSERNVLVILGHSEGFLLDLVNQLFSGTFRSGLVDELLGVYGSP